jgi:hypothetical protein
MTAVAGEIGDVPALIQAVAQRYDGADNEAERLAQDALQRLSWRMRHSGKHCSACDEVHPIAAFGPDGSRADGLAHRCRDSDSARKREARRSK